MPRVRVRDPAWLARSTPGGNLFRADGGTTTTSSRDSRQASPRKTVAVRGTELLVAVGKEVRWSEIGWLKEAGGRTPADGERAYRVLKTPVARAITQLSVSPSGDFLAVLTSHTCHVCILPAPSHLRTVAASSPALRLKSFQIGPTAHVLEQSPLASALWHPLSPWGNGLVTITHDACVRLWELDTQNTSSFNEPALAVDLKKLGNATSALADMSASRYGVNKGYSPDQVEMQVAAACFGGQGRDDEHGWASMTLWVAMTEGDVYALCPFLPSKWYAPLSLLPTLSTSVTEKSRAMSQDPETTEGERRTAQQQCQWLADVDAQEPMLRPGPGDFDTVEVYTRPERPTAIPKLQGPFSISPAPDLGEITDIYVIAPKVDDAALYYDDDDIVDAAADEGLSVSIVCLATSTNEVQICLDLDGVEAEWLPSKRSRSYTFDSTADERALLLLETVDLAQSEAEDDGWPTFTASPIDRYELFVTHPMGVCGLSFRPWVGPLEDELAAPSVDGAGFRLNVVLESSSTLIDRPIVLPTEPDRDINTAVAVSEPGLGHIVLTAAMNIPFAAILDDHSQAHNPYAPDAPRALPAPEPRAPYRPAPDFDQTSELPRLLKLADEKRLLGGDLKSQVRFSPATLLVMTEAHRVMSIETHRLGVAAADLFRRCERMRSELHEQIRRVAELAARADDVTGEVAGGEVRVKEEVKEEAEEEGEGERGEEEGGEEEDNDDDDDDDEQRTRKEKIDARMRRTRSANASLHTRVDALRRKMLALGGRQLSAKEQAFAEEMERLERSVLKPGGDGDVVEDDDENHSSSLLPPVAAGSLTARFDSVLSLRDRLLTEAREAVERSTRGGEGEGETTATTTTTSSTTTTTTATTAKKTGGGGSGGGVDRTFRKQKLQQVWALLDRETALVDAVTERLARLQRAA